MVSFYCSIFLHRESVKQKRQPQSRLFICGLFYGQHFALSIVFSFFPQRLDYCSRLFCFGTNLLSRRCSSSFIYYYYLIINIIICMFVSKKPLFDVKSPQTTYYCSSLLMQQLYSVQHSEILNFIFLHHFTYRYSIKYVPLF